MSFHLRPVTPADVEVCYDLDQICFAPGIAFTREVMAEVCAHAAVMLLAEDDGRLVGFVAADCEAGEADGLIVTLDVDPAWRRQGIGTRLLAAASDALRERGVDLILLHVAVANREARALYKKQGYTTLKHLRGYYGPRRDALLLARRLENGGIENG